MSFGTSQAPETARCIARMKRFDFEKGLAEGALILALL
jgi:hypothetical protein